MTLPESEYMAESKLRSSAFVVLFFLSALYSVGAENSAPTRIVSIAPSFTEILYGLGLKNEIIGTTNYCDYPAEAKQTAKIGDVLNPNVEKVISLKPDLVFAGAWKWKVPAQLRAVGIHVIEIPDADSLEGVYGRFLMIGEQVNHKEKAESLVQKIRADLQKIRARNEGSIKKVYVELDTGNWTAGGGSYLSEILKTVGLENIFAERKEAYFTVTLESIVSRRPDLIVSLSRKKQDFQKAAEWQALQSVQKGFILDDTSMDWNAIMRQGPRLAQGVERLEALVKDFRSRGL